jgi:bacterioferritin-associated ferredoxin
MYLCLCKGIKESRVKELGRAGLITPEMLISTLGIDDASCCGRCLRNIDSIATLAISAWEDTSMCAAQEQYTTGS